MPTPEETRRQKIAERLLEIGFVQAGLPDERNTLIDFRALHELVKNRAAEYRAAEPFPHIVIDDFLPEDSFRAVHEALPRRDDPSIVWGNLSANLPDGRPAQQHKYHLQNVLLMKPPVRELIGELNSGPFTLNLQRLTGVMKLITDPLLQGGGVHLVEAGGLLRVHADFNQHPSYQLKRRLNLLLYFNEDWREEYGGHLELWNRDVSQCVQRIPPIANRCVIFNTSSDSYHGHPHALTCPQGVVRKSIALYYYTVDTSEQVEDGQARGHGTLWQVLPHEKQSG
jgi:Rps23 Pro-64 3,4-dihydroxylase Tpa1-like proline 4-hydroxylase